MSYQKIPDRSNFLEKFAAVEKYLQKKDSPLNEPTGEVRNNIEDYSPAESGRELNEIEEVDNSQNIISPSATLQNEQTCSKCGAPRRPEDVFCMNCGNKHEAIPETQTTNNEAESQTKNAPIIILKCSKCGTPHKSEAVFCMNCGNKL